MVTWLSSTLSSLEFWSENAFCDSTSLKFARVVCIGGTFTAPTTNVKAGARAPALGGGGLVARGARRRRRRGRRRGRGRGGRDRGRGGRGGRGRSRLLRDRRRRRGDRRRRR